MGTAFSAFFGKLNLARCKAALDKTLFMLRHDFFKALDIQ
jgi:hypothetical protein